MCYVFFSSNVIGNFVGMKVFKFVADEGNCFAQFFYKFFRKGAFSCFQFYFPLVIITRTDDEIFNNNNNNNNNSLC